MENIALLSQPEQRRPFNGLELLREEVERAQASHESTNFTGDEKLKLLSSVVDAVQRLPTHSNTSTSTVCAPSPSSHSLTNSTTDVKLSSDQYPSPVHSRSSSPKTNSIHSAKLDDALPLPTLSETLCRIFPQAEVSTTDSTSLNAAGRMKFPTFPSTVPPPPPPPNCTPLPHIVPKGTPRPGGVIPPFQDGLFLYQNSFGPIHPSVNSSASSNSLFTINSSTPHTPPSTPTDLNGNITTKGKLKQFSFVNIPGVSNKKRPRRKYDDVERHYACNYSGCTKSYGTLNHLNAHVTMQRHGPKRLASEFKDLRKQLKLNKLDKELTTCKEATPS